jgi:hypothetical protein
MTLRIGGHVPLFFIVKLCAIFMNRIPSPAPGGREPRPLLEQVVTNCGECAALFDRDYNHLIVSADYAARFGQSRQQVEGRPIERLWQGHQHDDIRPWPDDPRCRRRRSKTL